MIIPGSTEPALSGSRMGRQLVLFGSLPKSLLYSGYRFTLALVSKRCVRQAAGHYRLAACAPQSKRTGRREVSFRV